MIYPSPTANADQGAAAVIASWVTPAQRQTAQDFLKFLADDARAGGRPPVQLPPRRDRRARRRSRSGSTRPSAPSSRRRTSPRNCRPTTRSTRRRPSGARRGGRPFGHRHEEDRRGERPAGPGKGLGDATASGRRSASSSASPSRTPRTWRRRRRPWRRRRSRRSSAGSRLLELEAATRGKTVVVPAARRPPSSRVRRPTRWTPTAPCISTRSTPRPASPPPSSPPSRRWNCWRTAARTMPPAARPSRSSPPSARTSARPPTRSSWTPPTSRTPCRSFLQDRSDTLVEFQSKADEQLTRLQEQMDRLRALKANAQSQHEALSQACRTEIARLEQVRDFFRREVPAR